MATITTAYSVGDVVYHAGTATERKQHPCPDCKGERQWKAISPAGEEYTFSCPRCAASYRSFDGISLDYTAHVPCVSKLTVGSVRYESAGSRPGAQYMCLETGVGSGRVYNEADLYETEDAATGAADMLARLANTETEWVAKLYDKTLTISDYQLSSALLRVAKDEQSRARSLLWNIGDLFSTIEDAEDKEAILGAIADYKRSDFEYDQRAAIADRNPEGGDVKQAPSHSDESGGAGTAIAQNKSQRIPSAHEGDVE
jgi:hypothetical protein